LKNDLPKIEKFEKKNGWEGFEEGNNILHTNFFIFGMDFKLKI
jgi:hypothetical protein